MNRYTINILFILGLFSLALVSSCVSTHEKEFAATEDVVIQETQTYFVAHGGDLLDTPHLFDKHADVPVRLKEARAVLRKVWSDLETQGNTARVDFMSEFSMMLGQMLSFARVNED